MTFTRAIKVATETEDAAKVAKETVFGSIPEHVKKVKGFLQTHKKDKGKCYRCGKAGHLAPDCYFKKATCNYCKLQGYLESVSRKKKSKVPIKTAKIISVCNATNASDNFLQSSQVANSSLHQFLRGLYEIGHCNGRQFSFTRSLKKVGQTGFSKVLPKISIGKQAFTAGFGNVCRTNYSGN